MKFFDFKIEKSIKGSLGRAGVFSTPHGNILTPSFVVVGTKGTIKSLTVEQLKSNNINIVLANTYHLYLQPGDELIKNAGGLHKFMNWHGPLMTDSGGFQVFSLGSAYGKEISKVVSITDPNLLITERSSVEDGIPRLATIGNDGVSFRSHIDGSIHYITPEKSISIQHNLGADIIFAFDECTSPVETDLYQDEALLRTHAWAKRSLVEHKKLELKKSENNLLPQALFGIVQGGRSEILRRKSANIIGEMGFDGYGIGGSFAKEDMSKAVKWVNEILPINKPRHLLGIGEPEDLFIGVENGVDLFDCVAPTRIARNGTLYTKNGKINILNSKFRKDLSSIDEGCDCDTCKVYTKAYLSHLFRAKEMLGATLATIHNIYFITKLVSDMRKAIINDKFILFKDEFLLNYKR